MPYIFLEEIDKTINSGCCNNLQMIWSMTSQKSAFMYEHSSLFEWEKNLKVISVSWEARNLNMHFSV